MQEPLVALISGIVNGENVDGTIVTVSIEVEHEYTVNSKIVATFIIELPSVTCPDIVTVYTPAEVGFYQLIIFVS